MGSNYILSLHPTFTQGLIFGQLSVLILLVLVVKYLFLDSTQHPFETTSYHPTASNNLSLRNEINPSHVNAPTTPEEDVESAEWFNILAQQIVTVYRSKLRDSLLGVEGDEIVRKRIEDFANSIRPSGFLDHIKINSVDLGVSAPRLSNARINKQSTSNPLPETEFDVIYTDSLSLSLSTSYLFNYPVLSFARLPVSVTISLSLFKSSITITPPSTTSSAPVLTINIPQNFILDLTTTSLIGSRAKLADVPKLHELIQHQVRRILASRATWKIVMPGLSSLPETRLDIKKELSETDP